MTREELEHIIRASGNITNQYEFVILGSQSILGAIPNPPAFFTMSAEADIYPLAEPELADQIDGAIGEGSDFHDTHGFYAQGVGPTRRPCRTDGWIASTGYRTPTPTCGSACASALPTSSCPRPGPAGTRIGSSASACFSTPSLNSKTLLPWCN
jgi:hypothetical protein